MGSYLLVNFAIATGIAADAVIVTLANARRFDRPSVVWRWSSAVGLTHWLLPFAGFLGGWWLLRYPALRAAVYAMAALVMAGLARNAFVGALAAGRHDGLVDDGPFPTWGLVWAVSVDALATGPGKVSAAAEWSTAQMAWSFMIVGATVAAYVFGAGYVAWRIQRQTEAASGGTGPWMARWRTVFLALETVTFSCFAGLGADRAAAELVGQWPEGTLVWAALALVVALWLFWARRLHAGQVRAVAAERRGQRPAC
jgi:putative Mn2+ efflux pump MntP